MQDNGLRLFVRHSNAIEGITSEPTAREIVAYELFLTLPDVISSDITFLVLAICSADMRTRVGMDVRVGNHHPPRGGPDILTALDGLLTRINDDEIDPWTAHVEYETLHPFMDGNGRSGRALWLWMMLQRDGRMPHLGFLHAFYYQTLGASHDR